MKLHPKQKILKATASYQDNRFTTQGVRLAEGGELVATNGRIAVVIPGVAEDSDTKGRTIDASVVKEAMRAGPTRGQIDVGDRESRSGNGAVESNLNGEYPRWENVIPEVTGSLTKVSLNPRLLMDLIEASGVLATREPVITLYFDDNRRPVRINTNADSGAYGVIMPLTEA